MKKIEDLELIFSIAQTKQELRLVNLNFQTAEPELVDYYSYQIKANKAKLDYLIKQAKQKEISIDSLEGIELGLYENKAI